MTADKPVRRILLVEDSADDRIALRSLLREHSPEYEITEAATGEEGLGLCRAVSPDCVLLDFVLPDMTGTEFLHRLLCDDGDDPTRVPIALLTGHEDHRAAAEALKRGAQDYVVKGTLTGHGLVRVIENAIEKFHIRRELEEKRAALELRSWELESVRDQLQSKISELTDATKAKDQFVAVMSHEMRTPLNAILGYADLLEMGIGGALLEAQREYVDRIRLGGRHLLDLINDVLDFARAEAHRVDLDLRPVDLAAVLEEVVALLETQARSKGIELRAEGMEGVPHVHADPQRLRQVFINVIGNAVKFTDDGSVTIRCEEAAGQKVRVEVIDTGIGISPEALPQIFTEFFQADGKLTREYGGSGLGLAVAQRLVALMGGEISARSTPDEGSIFTLLLPMAESGAAIRPADVQQHRAAMSAHAARVARRSPGRAITVAAYAPDEDALNALEERVHPSVKLIWTTEVDELPELALREGATLVVLDISAGDGLAWRAAHALQEVEELASTPVLLLPRIPVAAVEDLGEGLDLGWVSLVPKPFTAQQLTHAVERAAGERDADGEADYEVLVVDDDGDSRRVAAQFLSLADARVREAPDGETALVMMRRRRPDVVVLDLMMPVLDGFGVLATMRADPRLADIPVVVLSAKSLSEAERQFLARTAVRVLQKGEHRLADVAALVLRAAASAPKPLAAPAAPGPAGELEPPPRPDAGSARSVAD